MPQSRRALLLAAGGVSSSLAFAASEPVLRIGAAASAGDLKTLARNFDRDPASIYARNEKGQSIFLLACLGGQTDAAKLLIQRGLILDLHEAAAAGNKERVNALLGENPGSINHRDLLGATPFHYAVACGQLAMVNQLLAKGADLSAPAPGLDGAAPCHLAAQNANHELACKLSQTIVGNGANPNAARYDGRTALDLGAARGNTELVRFLARKGARGEAASAGSSSIARDCYTGRYRGVVREDTYGIPRLWINQFVTVAHFDFDKVKSLLSQCSALLLTRATWDELAVEAAAHMGREDIANFLLDKGSPLSLCTATMLGRTSDVKTILAEDNNRVRERGAHDFPLLWYTIFGHERVELAEMLIGAGADPKAGLMGGSTAMAMARKKSYNGMVDLLQKNGVS
ncbi:MAG: ankyrin repeat domain-containing protein [Bryobacteraceae bacterium]